MKPLNKEFVFSGTVLIIVMVCNLFFVIFNYNSICTYLKPLNEELVYFKYLLLSCGIVFLIGLFVIIEFTLELIKDLVKGEVK